MLSMPQHTTLKIPHQHDEKQSRLKLYRLFRCKICRRDDYEAKYDYLDLSPADADYAKN